MVSNLGGNWAVSDSTIFPSLFFTYILRGEFPLPLYLGYVDVRERKENKSQEKTGWPRGVLVSGLHVSCSPLSATGSAVEWIRNIGSSLYQLPLFISTKTRPRVTICGKKPSQVNTEPWEFLIKKKSNSRSIVRMKRWQAMNTDY